MPLITFKQNTQIYASGPALGLWAVVAGRCILGAMSACSVATQSYVSTNTSVEDRTRYMSINTLVSNTLTAAGPLFNLLIVNLPRSQLALAGQTVVFNRQHTSHDRPRVSFFVLQCYDSLLAVLLQQLHLGGVLPARRAAGRSCLHPAGIR